MAKLKTILKRSVIRHPQDQRATVKALGLGRVNGAVTKPANEATKGMINTISHLADVEEV